MKNHEEFRSAVFEKAEKYKARQKARNKKIAEISCLCSLAFVIAISAYLGLFPSLDQTLPEHTEESTSASLTETTGSSATSSTADASESATSVTATQTETTTATTIETTTMWTTAVESTTEHTFTETTDSSLESHIMPIISKLEFRATAKESDFAIGKTELLEIASYTQWLHFLEENADDYPALEQNGILIDACNEEYFAENILIVVQFAGYDIIAFGSDIPLDPSSQNQKYTFYINLCENEDNQRKQIHILSVDKDTYKDTKIRIWEKSEN